MIYRCTTTKQANVSDSGLPVQLVGSRPSHLISSSRPQSRLSPACKARSASLSVTNLSRNTGGIESIAEGKNEQQKRCSEALFVGA